MTVARRQAGGILRVLAAVCLGASAVAASAADPATRPARSRGRRGARHVTLTDEQLQEVLAFARKHYPQEAEKLERLLGEDRVRAMAIARRLQRVRASVRRYPEPIVQAALDRRKASLAIYRTVRDLRRNEDPARRAALIDRIKALLSEQLDHEQKIKKYEVTQLEKRVAQLAERIKAGPARRDEIIAARLDRWIAPRKPATRPSTSPTSRRAHPRGRGRDRRLTAGQLERMMAFTKAHAPKIHKHLVKLRQSDTPRARSLLYMVHGLIRPIRSMPPRVRRAAIAVHEANVGLLRPARQARKSKDPAERKRLAASMRVVLVEQFKDRQIVREYDVKRLRKELADLRADVQKRSDDREKIIAERLARLTSPRRPTTQPSSAPS